MSLGPYSTLDLTSCVWQGWYAPRRCCYAMLFTPDPALHPPGPNGWKWAVHIHGGGMRQWGRKIAELGANAYWLELCNNLNIAFVLITYTPGSFESADVQFPGYKLFPDAFKDAANAIQFFKKHSANAAIVGVNGLLSTREDDIVVSGLSAGAFVAAGSQLQPDGAFAYNPGAETDDDPYAYTHNHCASVLRLAIPQLWMSTLSAGAESPDVYPFTSYAEFGWWGPYVMDYHEFEDGGGVDSLPMSRKRPLNVAELINAANPRLASMKVYLAGQADAYNANVIANLANAADPLSFLNTTNAGRAHFDPTLRDTDYRDLHSNHQLFIAAWFLKLANHVRWRLKGGDTTTNPDAGAAVINPDQRTIANVSYVGSTITVDTVGAHGFLTGAKVEIAGVVSTGTLASLINKTITLDSVSATQFVFTIGGAPTGAYTSGGTACSGRRYIFGAASAPWTQNDAQDFANFLTDAIWGAAW